MHVVKQANELAVPAGLSRIALKGFPYKRNAFVPVTGQAVSPAEVGEDVAVVRVEGTSVFVRRNAERRLAPQPMSNPDGLERQRAVRRQGYGVPR